MQAETRCVHSDPPTTTAAAAAQLPIAKRGTRWKWLNTPLGTTLITVVVGGVLLQAVIFVAQQVARANELALAERREQQRLLFELRRDYLREQDKAAGEAHRLIGRVVTASETPDVRS